MTDHTEDRDQHAPTAVSRRTFIKGAGLTAIAVGLGACDNGTDPGSTTTSSSTTSSTTSSSTTTSTTMPPPPPFDPATVAADWTEPRVWDVGVNGTRPLSLHVVENKNGLRFSWDGMSPGPTVRMRGDQTLYMTIHNDLGEDLGKTPVGPSPDPNENFPGPEGVLLATIVNANRQKEPDAPPIYGDDVGQIPTEPKPDWALGEHVNGVHAVHVTNLHTHGLHVRPGQNDNRTYSDDIYLRIVPQKDAIKIAEDPDLWRKYQEDRDEIVGSVADFEFQLGNVQEGLIGSNGQVIRNQPHPPGTYWYHPHSHGATQDQVASGMAGFLIIVGDVDEYVNSQMTGNSNIPWDEPTGPWDYRERDIFLQRTFVAPTANISGPSAGDDPDAPKNIQNKPKRSVRPSLRVNGREDAPVIVMRPGAAERWRVLNGSVDGNGYMRFAVLKGQFADTSGGTLERNDGGPRDKVNMSDYKPLSVGESEEPVEKAKIWLLAWDGITRVIEEPPGSGQWIYRVKDLSTVNGGQEPNLASEGDCYKAENLALCYWRPNEVAMADANRADVIFQAPALAGTEPEVYTVVAMPTSVHGSRPEGGGTTKVLAHVVVRGDPVEGGTTPLPFDEILDGLRVSQYELPVRDDEVLISNSAEQAARGVGPGQYRTRVLHYSGWGANGLPLVDANPEYVAANPGKEKLSYYTARDSVGSATNIRRYPDGMGDLPDVLLPALTRTMAIEGEKFFPTSTFTPRMLLNTSEEWAVYNQSIDLYSPASPEPNWTADETEEYLRNNPEIVWYDADWSDPPSGTQLPGPYFGSHQYSYAMTPAAVRAVNANRELTPGSKGPLALSAVSVDHPFHIHQNPFWLMRIDVPDENGDLVNILPEPIWSDTVWLPRNGGRVVFRSRFVDYEGEFVNHCHILLHEDNGMMQRNQIIGDPATSNYEPRPQVVQPGDSEAQVDGIYDKPSLGDSWQRSLHFIDANNSGQVYPGDEFVAQTPTPPTS